MTKDSLILELGGASEFSFALAEHGLQVSVCDQDLRYPLNRGSGMYDAVLCMEVLEHVADTDGLHTEWKGDGANTLLREAFRVLKPGGFLFLTTPNAASITAIHHALKLSPGMVYRPHVREYAPYELDELVRAAGFHIESRVTLDVWRNAISSLDHERISRFIRSSSYPAELRGEDIFLLATKPQLA